MDAAPRVAPTRTWTMDLSCNACSTGPAGIAGHGKLCVHLLDGAEMVFRCEDCKAQWTRSRNGPGRFEWTLVDDRSALKRGALGVPPRSNPLAAFAWRPIGRVKPA